MGYHTKYGAEFDTFIVRFVRVLCTTGVPSMGSDGDSLALLTSSSTVSLLRLGDPALGGPLA